MNNGYILERIKEHLPDARIDIQGQDCSFSITVISSEFSGQRPVQRQQGLLALFSQELADGSLHALTVDACTPEEWAGRQSVTSICL